MHYNILYYIKRPELTPENKQFYTIRYLSRSLIQISIASIVFNILTKTKMKRTQLFIACYYLGFSLRKINNLTIKPNNEIETETTIQKL
jgi:hypothetical protein